MLAFDECRWTNGEEIWLWARTVANGVAGSGSYRCITYAPDRGAPRQQFVITPPDSFMYAGAVIGGFTVTLVTRPVRGGSSRSRT